MKANKESSKIPHFHRKISFTNNKSELKEYPKNIVIINLIKKHIGSLTNFGFPFNKTEYKGNNIKQSKVKHRIKTASHRERIYNNM